MSDRLFDRNNYSSKTLENFEIMSAYYVDIFYNHLYIEAKKLKAHSSVSSITDGYKHTLNAFLKGLENPKLYKKSIVGMHHYFITIGFASISFSKCVDKLTKEFIPTDYFNSLTVTQKMGVLRMVLNQSLKTFIRKLVDEHMAKIIDYHMEKDNVRILQDEMIDCFILEREGMYQRFIAEGTKTNKNETVNRHLAEKMQQEIKRLVKEKYTQQKQILILKKILLKKKGEENQIREVNGNLKAEIESLKSDKLRRESINDTQTSRFFSPTSLVIHRPSTPPTQQIERPIERPITKREQKGVKREPEKKEENVEIVSYDDQGDDSSFIEVNNNNIHNIIEGDSENLYKINNNKMDEGTTLEDFS